MWGITYLRITLLSCACLDQGPYSEKSFLKHKKKKSLVFLLEEILPVVFFKGESELTNYTMKFNISWNILLVGITMWERQRDARPRENLLDVKTCVCLCICLIYLSWSGVNPYWHVCRRIEKLHRLSTKFFIKAFNGKISKSFTYFPHLKNYENWFL